MVEPNDMPTPGGQVADEGADASLPEMLDFEDAGMEPESGETPDAEQSADAPDAEAAGGEAVDREVLDEVMSEAEEANGGDALTQEAMVEAILEAQRRQQQAAQQQQANRPPAPPRDLDELTPAEYHRWLGQSLPYHPVFQQMRQALTQSQQTAEALKAQMYAIQTGNEVEAVVKKHPEQASLKAEVQKTINSTGMTPDQALAYVVGKRQLSQAGKQPATKKPAATSAPKSKAEQEPADPWSAKPGVSGPQGRAEPDTSHDAVWSAAKELGLLPNPGQ